MREKKYTIVELYNKGVTLITGGKSYEAIAWFDKILEIDPKFKGAWGGKGMVLTTLKMHEGAIECYDKALEIDPKDKDVWKYKGCALADLERHEEAIKCYDKVLEIDPKDKRVWNYKGMALRDLEKHEEAIECYDKVLEIDPKDKDVWIGKGAAYIELEKHEEAIKCYNKALEIDPKFKGAWVAKGMVLRELKKYEEAIECYEMVVLDNIENGENLKLLEEKYKKDLKKEVGVRTKELDEAFKHQKLYLDQIVKLSQTKQKFMATMNHELRTPLNTIIGFCELLMEGAFGTLTNEQLEFMTDIKLSAEHQFMMVNSLLDAFKVESGRVTLNIQKFSLNSIIEQVKSYIKPECSKKSLTFEVKGLNNKKFMHADPIRFKEILFNLLSNAINFTIKGGITLIIKEKKDKWEFKVVDTGIGIAEKDFNIIFEDFERVQSDYVDSIPGCGLGLPIAKRLVNLHGGSISFTSEFGQGTTFTFTIPKKYNSSYYENI